MGFRHVRKETQSRAAPAGNEPPRKRLVSAAAGFAGAVALLILRGYKNYISPFLPHACRFEPTCSVYMYQAIRKKGLVKGVFLGIKRLLRCHPFCEGGIDPVP